MYAAANRADGRARQSQRGCAYAGGLAVAHIGHRPVNEAQYVAHHSESDVGDNK